MSKHHVNPNTGNPGICKSAKGKCPFGSEDEHYGTPEAASEAAEKLMAEQYSAINTAYRKKDSSALDGMNREMKKRIISEAASGKVNLHPSVVAKVFSKDNDELIRKNVSENFKSQKILREMSTDESARVRLAVAKSTNNPDVLKAMANDPDVKVRKAAIENQRTPVKARKAALATLGVKPAASTLKPKMDPSVKRMHDTMPAIMSSLEGKTFRNGGNMVKTRPMVSISDLGTQEMAANNCYDASSFVLRSGALDGVNHLEKTALIEVNDPTSEGHTAIYMKDKDGNEMVLDFTARQFDPAADYPMLTSKKEWNGFMKKHLNIIEEEIYTE